MCVRNWNTNVLEVRVLISTRSTDEWIHACDSDHPRMLKYVRVTENEFLESECEQNRSETIEQNSTTIDERERTLDSGHPRVFKYVSVTKNKFRNLEYKQI